MSDSTGHAVAYTIGSILKHITDCVQLYFLQWPHECCSLRRQLSLACWRNTNL